jgi:hypothetical protein
LRANTHIIRLVSLLLILGIFPSRLWSWPADSQAPNQELSLQKYIAELRTASAALDGRNPRAIQAFWRALPSEWVVRVDGQSMKVETDWLAAALLIEENDPTASSDPLRQARQHLAALREAAEDLAAPAVGADLGQARSQVGRILRDREFQGSHEPSWLDRLKTRVYAWISRYLEKLFGRIGVSAAVGNTIAWTFVSLATLLLAFWCVRALIAGASRAEIDLRGATPAGQDWRYWAREARFAAERGDYRAAIHAAYWTAVARLEENHLLPEDRSRTPRESLRLVQRASAAYPPLAHLTRRFELIWYGYYAATSADWDDAMQQLETLECLRSSTEATAGS